MIYMWIKPEEYLVHDNDSIKGFFGEYRWLSNFHLCLVRYEELLYPSTENAYQAAKIEPFCRPALTTCTPSQSKSLWKTFPRLDKTPQEWDTRRYDIMAGLVFDKFLNNEYLRLKLLETGDKYLQELNAWKDVYWGVDFKTQKGENKLGEILMKTRTFWQ